MKTDSIARSGLMMRRYRFVAIATMGFAICLSPAAGADWQIVLQE